MEELVTITIVTVIIMFYIAGIAWSKKAKQNKTKQKQPLLV